MRARPARICVVTLLLACCTAISAQLSVGPVIPFGSTELGAWTGVDTRPAIASDGDEIFVVYAGGTVSYTTRSLSAVRFDRDGRVLTPVPLTLVSLTSAVAVMAKTEPRVVFAGGHYVVVYSSTESKLQALRVTRSGEVVAQKTLPFSASGQFELATDGDGILIATRGDKLLRMDSDLEVRGTIDVTPTKGSRGIAFGGGRYTIVTTGEREVTSQFVEDGRVTPPVRIAASKSDGGATEVRWAGSAFVAAWTECVDEKCLGSWARLSANGAAAGIVMVVDRFPRVTITPLDDETMFVTWEEGKAAYGRRLRSSGVVDSRPIVAGDGAVAAFRTAHGSLLVVDARMRFAMIEAPATAPLPNPLPLRPAVLTPANQVLSDVAVSQTEIALVSVRDWLTYDTVITIAARDGTFLREIPVESREVAIATDGREFFALMLDRYRDIWFFNAKEPARRIRLTFGAWGYRPDLEWNGTELVAVWVQYDFRAGTDEYRLLMQRLDRGGNGLAPISMLSAQPYFDRLPRLYRSGDELLVAWDNIGAGTVTRLDAHGNVVGPVDRLPDSRQGMLSLAVRGRTEAAVFSSTLDPSHRLMFAFRERGGAFTVSPPVIVEADRWISSAVLAATRAGFVAMYSVSSSSSSGLRAILVDEGAVIADAVIADTLVRGVLVELTPGTLLAVYTRFAEEWPYDGTFRTFGRVITVPGRGEIELPKGSPARP